MATDFDRRRFLKTSAIVGSGIMMSSATAFGKKKKVSKNNKINIAFIGTGLRGRNHLRNILLRDDVHIPAICDISPVSVTAAEKMIAEHNHPKVEVYSDGEYAYLEMLKRDDIDGVIISTPWLWHTRMAVATMKAGKHAGLEVSAANTLEECWDLVNTHEETGKHCMILENVCYRRDVMAVLNMVRQGLFGEMMHARCGYLHDLREVKFNDGKRPYGGGVEFGEKGFSEAQWRTNHSLKRNGDVYPTHGLGPVATMMDINRGNRFTFLTATSTKARGLHNYIVNHPEGGPDHPNAKLHWKQGDIITSTVETANGETIIITHDCNLPRPYSLGFRVQGVNGLADFDYHTDRVYIEGKSPSHQWEDLNPYIEKYDHPLWKKYGKTALDSGHGGMDFFVDHAFIEFIKQNDQPPMDAYDAAAWSAVTPLSEASIENNGAPQEFPDFTRGRWVTNKPIFSVKGDLY